MKQYRAWDKTCEIMVYNVQNISGYIYKPEFQIPLRHWSKTEIGLAESFGALCCNPNVVVMESFRDRVDVDGKPIFDGDIVQGIDSPAFGVVGWISGIEDVPPWQYAEGLVLDMYHGGSNKVRVVGNVFQNPEMLGGMKKNPPPFGEG